MSEEQLKAFLEKVKFDTKLQEKLEAAASPEAAIAIAKEAGFSITAEDIQSMRNSTEVSDEELESAAGGTQLVAFPMMRVPSFTAGQIFIRNDPDNPSET